MIVEFKNSKNELKRYEDVLALYSFGDGWFMTLRDERKRIFGKELVSIKTEEFEKEKAKEMGLEHLAR